MKNLLLILAVMLLALTSHGSGLTVSTFYGISSNQFLETPTNDNAALTGTTSARGPWSGPFQPTTNNFQPVFTNGGWLISNAVGWVFQGSNGLYVSSNTLSKTAIVIDTNRVVTWKSNNVVWITINPIDGSVRLENSVGNHGLVYGNVAMFNTFSNALPDEAAQMGGDFSFLNNVGIGGDFQAQTATFGDSVTMQQDLSVLGGISGDGFSITDLNADNLASGIIPLVRLPSAVVTNNYSGTFSSSEVLADTLGGKAGDDIHMVGNIRLDPGSGSGSIVDKSGNTLIDANGNFTGALLKLDADTAESDGPYTFDTSEADTLKIKTPLGGGLTIDSGNSTIYAVFPFSLAGDGSGLTNVTAASVADTNVVVSTNTWSWPGPTNNLDFARGTLQRYRPTGTTAINITNVLHFPSGQVGSVVLWIENTNTSALSVKLPSTCEATNSLGGLTVSVNASNRLQVLMSVAPAMAGASGSTNALFSDQQLIK